MSPKRKRLSVVVLGLSILGVAAALVLNAFEENLVFFFSPTELQAQEIGPDRRIRVGGLVEEGSVKQIGGGTVEFRVTDLESTVTVTYTGLLPDLFREGQGIVAQGRFASGTFLAEEVLAKHDENYLPKEVAEALKKSGQWHGQEGEASQ